MDGVLTDPDLAMVVDVRQQLTHSRMRRHLTGGDPQRVRIQLIMEDEARVDVRTLIEKSRDLATTHINKFIELLPSLSAVPDECEQEE